MFTFSKHRKIDLQKIYTQPNRFYHGIFHIDSMLRQTQQITDLLFYPEAVELAIWYHDAVYDSNAKNGLNEIQSCELFMKDFGGFLNPDMLDLVSSMILATIKHQIPSFNNDYPLDKCVNDCKYFLDLDLSSLGAEEEIFKKNSLNIRKEYFQYTDEQYSSGRIPILENFLKRDRMFFTDFFENQLGKQARRNLENSISELKRWLLEKFPDRFSPGNAA